MVALLHDGAWALCCPPHAHPPDKPRRACCGSSRQSTATTAASSSRRSATTPGRRPAIDVPFVQDNHSRSKPRDAARMHFQTAPGQAKLVRCARGAIFDVVVDLRRGSPTFGRWEGFVLDDESMRQLFVPIGFAHGFCVTSEVADVVYKCSSFYDGATESGIAYDDPAIGDRVADRRRADRLRARRDRSAARRRRGRAAVPAGAASRRRLSRRACRCGGLRSAAARRTPARPRRRSARWR